MPRNQGQVATRSLTRREHSCAKFTRQKDNIHIITKHRMAEEVLDSSQKVEKHLTWREETGDVLQEMITGLDPLESEDLEKGYQKKMMTFKLILIGLRF